MSSNEWAKSPFRRKTEMTTPFGSCKCWCILAGLLTYTGCVYVWNAHIMFVLQVIGIYRSKWRIWKKWEEKSVEMRAMTEKKSTISRSDEFRSRLPIWLLAVCMLKPCLYLWCMHISLYSLVNCTPFGGTIGIFHGSGFHFLECTNEKQCSTRSLPLLYV